MNIPLDLVYGNPNQPRKHFNEGELESLADSIKLHGVQQPIQVRPDAEGKFMVIAGERRYRASKLAGKKDIPAIVTNCDDTKLFELAIVENYHRANISPIEEALAFKVKHDAGQSIEEIAASLGIRQSWRVRDRLKLLNLTPKYQEFLRIGALTIGQANAMADLSADKQDKIFSLIKDGKCDSAKSLKGYIEKLQSVETTELFNLPVPSKADVAIANKYEKMVDNVTKYLNNSIKDNEVVALRKINPNQANKLREQIKLMISSLTKISDSIDDAGQFANLFNG